jgi:hypothetical protein
LTISMLNVASHFIFIYNFKKCDCNIQIVPYSLNLPPICNLSFSLKGGLEKSKELNLDVRNNFVKPPTELCRKCSKLSRSMVFNTFFFLHWDPFICQLELGAKDCFTSNCTPQNYDGIILLFLFFAIPSICVPCLLWEDIYYLNWMY